VTLDQYLGGSCIYNLVTMQFRNEARVQSNVLVGPMHSKLASRFFWRSEGRGWLGCWFIDLNPASRLAHDLISLFLGGGVEGDLRLLA
jgi:hypothetical protein